MSQTEDRTELRKLLARHDQTHLLQFWDELDTDQRSHLVQQISKIDFEQLTELIQGSDSGPNWESLAARAQSPPAIRLDTFFSEPDYGAAVEAGQQAISAGRVAMILTAGGQGTRLGFDHPKGLFPIGPISQRSLYQMIIEQVMARARQFDSRIPLYIMTSPPTHEASETFLTNHHFFNYDSRDARLFCQGAMPAVDSEGKILLAEKGAIFLSPDGHGGTLAALDRNHCLVDMQQRGIQHVFYGQVDNPLMQVCDPALIGYHILRESEMTTQVIQKTDPLQKVGNVVSVDGRVQIIEYSDLPDEFARRTDAKGNLELWAGNIAIHVFELAFLSRASREAGSLPFHRACKKVPFVDQSGKTREPDTPNALKFEKFIFDLLPLAKNAIVCEVEPARGFCAVKNAAPAASETPQHVQAAISDLHKNWLVECGVEVTEGVQIEINPMYAVDAKQLAGKIGDLKHVNQDTYFI